MKIPSETPKVAPDEFSLILGGPLYQVLLHIGLVKPPPDRVGGRILVISMTAWLPLGLSIFSPQELFLRLLKLVLRARIDPRVGLLVSSAQAFFWAGRMPRGSRGFPTVGFPRPGPKGRL